MLPFLIMLALVRSPPAYRPIPVCGPFNFNPRTGCRQQTLHTDLVHQGISEKVALVVSFLAAFFTGFVLAFARNWRLSLAMSFSMLPSISIAGAFMNKFISKYMRYVCLPGVL